MEWLLNDLFNCKYIRWAALALCLRESTSGLMHVLLLISKVFERVQHANAQLHEGEITVILPALIERAGHKSERHKAAFKSVIATARKVVAPNRLCQLLVQVLAFINTTGIMYNCYAFYRD